VKRKGNPRRSDRGYKVLVRYDSGRVTLKSFLTLKAARAHVEKVQEKYLRRPGTRTIPKAWDIADIDIVRKDTGKPTWRLSVGAIRAPRKRRETKLTGWRAFPAIPSKVYRPPKPKKARIKYSRKYPQASKRRKARHAAAKPLARLTIDQWDRLGRLEEIKVEKRGKKLALLDASGAEIARVPVIPVAAIRQAVEMRRGRMTPKLAKAWGLNAVKGFKAAEYDAEHGLATYSKTIYSSPRGLPVGQEKAPSKWLGELFEGAAPQDWIDYTIKSLPGYMRRKGARGFFGMRLWFKPKGGKRQVVEQLLPVSDIRTPGKWIKLLADAASDIGRRHGYEGRNRVLRIDLLVSEYLMTDVERTGRTRKWQQQVERQLQQSRRQREQVEAQRDKAKRRQYAKKRSKAYKSWK